MRVQCAWCKKWEKEKPPYEDKDVSHTICQECAEAQRETMKEKSNPEKITMDQLRNLVALLNRETDQQYDYDLDSGYGGYRLVSHGQSRDVSPRMGKTELYYWIHAFRDGIQVGQAL